MSGTNTHHHGTGITLSAAKDVAEVALLIRRLKDENAELKREAAERRTDTAAAHAAVAAARKRLDAKRQDEHALYEALMRLNQQLLHSREQLRLAEEDQRALELRSATAAVEAEEELERAASAKAADRSARGQLEVALMLKDVRGQSRREKEMSRRSELGAVLQARAQQRRSEAQKLRAELRSAALQRDIQVATATVDSARHAMADVRPTFRRSSSV
jgi:hypothetical protein